MVAPLRPNAKWDTRQTSEGRAERTSYSSCTCAHTCEEQKYKIHLMITDRPKPTYDLMLRRALPTQPSSAHLWVVSDSLPLAPQGSPLHPQERGKLKEEQRHLQIPVTYQLHH